MDGAGSVAWPVSSSSPAVSGMQVVAAVHGVVGPPWRELAGGSPPLFPRTTSAALDQTGNGSPPWNLCSSEPTPTELLARGRPYPGPHLACSATEHHRHAAPELPLLCSRTDSGGAPNPTPTGTLAVVGALRHDSVVPCYGSRGEAWSDAGYRRDPRAP